MSFHHKEYLYLWLQQIYRMRGGLYFLGFLVLCFLLLAYLGVLGGSISRIPGPFSAKFSRLWMVKHSWQGDMHRTMIALHRKHGKLVRTGPNEVSVSDLAAIKKIYRCHPAVGMSLPRVTPAGGVEIDNRFIPEGTIVGVNPWVVHRDTQVFGEDVEAFRPDRWLKDVTGDMERFFFAFGSGARMCLGRNLSWIEMSKLIPTMFLHFEMELTQPDAVWKETCWWFVKQEGVHVTVRARCDI